MKTNNLLENHASVHKVRVVYFPYMPPEAQNLIIFS